MTIKSRNCPRKENVTYEIFVLALRHINYKKLRISAKAIQLSDVHKVTVRQTDWTRPICTLRAACTTTALGVGAFRIKHNHELLPRLRTFLFRGDYSSGSRKNNP